MKKLLNVLITGAGSPGFPGVVQSLRIVQDYRIRIVGTDKNSEATGRFLVDSFHVVPPARDPLFIPALLSICKEEQVDVVLPMVSAELLVLADNKAEFEKLGIKVSVSEPDKLQQVMNKGTLLRSLRDAGITVPKSITVRTAKELLEAISQLGYPQHAVCFKPTFGDGSRGFHILDENIDRIRFLFYEKPNSLYMSYSELLTSLQNVTDIPEVLVMEYLPNEEYSVDILADEGKVLTAVPRSRLETVNGITTNGVISKEDDVILYASQIVETLGLHGNIGVQVRRDVTSCPQLIEVNPRIQGTIVHCTAAGVNLPFLAVKLALHIPIESSEYEIRWGTRISRYWKEIFYDANGSSYAL